MKFFNLFFLISLSFSIAVAQKNTAFVDPFIGTEGEGHTFPGASFPFGMVKLGPDCEGHSNSGYISNGKIEGFSHTHVSGTGGGAKYGNILVRPFIGKSTDRVSATAFSDEVAEAGYYATTLDQDKIRAEMTVTENAGIHQYTFPKSNQSKILIDAGHHLFFGDQWGEAQQFVDSEIEVIGNNAVAGYSTVRHGWNFGGAYTVYFYAELSKPFIGFTTYKSGKESNKKVQFASKEKTQACLSFQTKEGEQIQLRVGISFLSTARAKHNLKSSLGELNFEQVKANAFNQWENILSKINIETKSEAEKTVFYTSLYHSYLMPVCREDENPKWKSEVKNYDDFYALWDTYRTSHPLMTILTPNRQVEMINSLLDIYKHEGYLPDARSGNDNGRTQGGSTADIVIADAFVKGLKGIDYELALEAMIKNAEVSPGGDERKEGRGGLSDYNTLGYVSTDFERSGSRTIEYSLCDYSIATLAKGLGKNDLYQKYLHRASNWENLWDENYDSEGYKGFIMPRKSNGEWHSDFILVNREADGGDTIRFNEFTTGYWEAFLYESSSWEYSLAIPHDVKTLIKKCGGEEILEKRLDTFFEKDYFLVSNEPGFFTPFLYTYMGKHHRTVDVVKGILDQEYTTARNGIPGNDDSGAMGAWFVFNAMGFYPNAGQDIYLISSPKYPSTTIELGEGKTFTVTKDHPERTYVKSAKLNGKPLNRAFLYHKEIIDGGLLELSMSKKPTQWGAEQLPPSLPKTNL
ncbi:GH92 family glycosyl hydrolase [Persicobacter diffluens]|uniref:Alpha-1,2-mannosidase n=1 Tax=Persicobacter diffluens TaxID=981 RepID=A0AAN4W4I3_9BACT|nr:hypothetical protein PEDI_46940 [Persicobacter diffluens]